MDDNKKLPSGWGEDDDEDFGFDSVDDDSGDIPWGNSAKKKTSKNIDEISDTDKAESIGQTLDNASENIESSDIPAETVKTQAVNKPASVPVYSNNTASKSKAVPILIAVIAILVIALGAVGVLLLTKNKSDDSDKSESSIAEQSTTAPQTEGADTTQPEETTVPKAETETTVATEPPTEAVTVPYEVYEEASIRVLDEFMQTYYGDSVMYGLFDVNGDSVPELFLEYDTEASSRSFLYVYNGVDYVEQLDLHQGGTRICTSEHLIEAEGYGGAYVRTIYVMDDTGNINVEAEIRSEALKNYLNDQQISESEYNDLHNYYDSKQWVEVGCYEYKRKNAKPQNSIISPDDPYYEIKQEILYSVDNEYYSGKNSYIENAPADMVFYAVGNRSNIKITNPKVYSGPGTNYSVIEVYTSNFYIVGENNSWYYLEWIDGAGAFSHSCYGYISKSILKYTTYDTSAAGSNFSFFNEPYSRKIITESGYLNLRSAPSLSAEVIITMPKDSPVTLYGSNSGGIFGGLSDENGWSYIGYTENGITYYGYASSEFIGVP